MSQKIQDRAYQLWEQAGRPQCDGAAFWQQAESELAHRKRYVRSGELRVEGEGTVDEVLDLALTHAWNNSLKLGAVTVVSEVSYEATDPNAANVNTIERLRLLFKNNTLNDVAGCALKEKVK